MKTLTTTLSFLIMSFGLMGQQMVKNVEISRTDYSLIEISDGETKYSIRSKDKQLNDAHIHYELIQGKGGEKDEEGIRARRKQYLVNTAQDTLAILIDKGEKIKLNDLVASRLSTEDGWIYLNENNDTLYTANLMWNKSKWNYELSSYNHSASETLDKIFMLSMVDLARARSKVDCDDDTFSDIWFILYASTLYNNN